MKTKEQLEIELLKLQIKDLKKKLAKEKLIRGLGPEPRHYSGYYLG